MFLFSYIPSPLSFTPPTSIIHFPTMHTQTDLSTFTLGWEECSINIVLMKSSEQWSALDVCPNRMWKRASERLRGGRVTGGKAIKNGTNDNKKQGVGGGEEVGFSETHENVLQIERHRSLLHNEVLQKLRKAFVKVLFCVLKIPSRLLAGWEIYEAFCFWIWLTNELWNCLYTSWVERKRKHSKKPCLIALLVEKIIESIVKISKNSPKVWSYIKNKGTVR